MQHRSSCAPEAFREPIRAPGLDGPRSMTPLNDFLQSIGCFAVKHSSRTLGDHLLGAYALITSFGGTESIALAGALHSI